MEEKDFELLCTLDKLKCLIRNTKRDGKVTMSKHYEDYYREVIEKPQIKEIIQKNNYNTEI